MKDISLFASTITYTNKQLAKLSKSLKHSLRVEEEEFMNKNYREDMSVNNLLELYKYNQERKQDKLNLEDKKSLLSFVENLINQNKQIEKDKLPNNKIDPKDSQMRSKSLKYLNTNIQDKEFKKLLNKFTETPNEDNKDNLINHFKTLDTKKAVEKNLHKYIGVIEKIGNAKSRSEASKLSYDPNKHTRTEFVEMVIRIPLHNEVSKIKSEEFMEYNKDFYKKYFPQYNIVVAAAHNDELHKEKYKHNQEEGYERKLIGQHSHVFVDTKNQETGKFDYYRQQHELIKSYLQSKGWKEYAITKKIGQYKEDGVEKVVVNGVEKEIIKYKRFQGRKEIREQGKLLQDFIYEDINKELLHKHELNAKQGFVVRTPEEKAQIENDKKQTSNDRYYNGQNFEKEQIEQEQKEIEQEKKMLEEFKENIVEDIKTEHSEKLSEIEQFKEVKEELSNEVVELESQVDYLSQEQIRENELKGKNDLKVEELEEITLKIIQKKEEESKIDISIQKLKEDRKKVSKEGMEKQIKSVVRKVVDNTDNYNYKFVDKDKMKSQMIKEVRKFLKVDMYDNDIKVIKERIQTESDNKVLEIKNQMGDLQKKFNEEVEEHTTLKDNVKSVIAEQVEKVEDTYKSTISTLEYNHKNSITASENNHKEKVSNLQTEHNQEIYKLNNIIDNKDTTISTLQKDKSRLENEVDKWKSKFERFKSKIKSIFIRSSDLNNGLKNTVNKLQDTTNEFREKVSDLEYDIKLINEYDNNLISKLNKEDDKRIEELFNKDRIILEEPTESKEPRLIIEPLDTKSLEINFDKDKEEDNNQSHSTGHRQ